VGEVDAIAFGAHPDDIEICCGGTLIKLVDAGHSVVLVDVVRGELSTRGTPDLRQLEAEAAAKIIGAVARENLELEDGNVHASKVGKRKVAEVVRKFRPRVAFLPYYRARHPDHYNTSNLVYEGIFLAGLPRYETGQEPHRPSRIFYYMTAREFKPTFIVDISNQFERKMQSIYSYASQFAPDNPGYPDTRLTSPNFKWRLVHHMAYLGSLIGKRYGEGFLISGTMEAENPLDVIFATF